MEHAMKPTEITPTLRNLAARAGYAQRIDIQRLLADLRRYPGCADLQSRTLSNYLSGYTHPPADVAWALCGALKITMDELMEAK
jgi:transcriptional regulator with XRE-family HTH domain